MWRRGLRLERLDPGTGRVSFRNSLGTAGDVGWRRQFAGSAVGLERGAHSSTSSSDGAALAPVPEAEVETEMEGAASGPPHLNLLRRLEDQSGPAGSAEVEKASFKDLGERLQCQHRSPLTASLLQHVCLLHCRPPVQERAA